MWSSLSNNIEHRYLIQSYIFTSARYNYSVWEKRILYRLVEYAQSEVEGFLIKDHIHRIQHNFKDVSISMPISSILAPTEKGNVNKHYSEAKKACRALGKKYLEWDDPEKGGYWGNPIIYNIHIPPKEGVMYFDVPNWVWDAILDFSKGFRKFDIVIAMRLHSQYSMRLFELMAGQDTPLTFTVEEIKKMFFLGEDKYKRTNDIYELLLRSKEELDRISPYSFNPKSVKKSNKIIEFNLFPVYISENEDKRLAEIKQTAKVTARLQLDQQVYDYLKYSFGFKSEEINRNKKTLVEAQKRIDNLMDFLVEIRKNALKANDTKSYVIGAIKKRIEGDGSSQNNKRQKGSPVTSEDRIKQLSLNFSTNITN